MENIQINNENNKENNNKNQLGPIGSFLAMLIGRTLAAVVMAVIAFIMLVIFDLIQSLF